jgi:hypothetical protein
VVSRIFLEKWKSGKVEEKIGDLEFENSDRLLR